MPSSVGFFTKLKGGLLGRGFDAAADDPGQAQEEILQRLLKTRSATAYGKDHSFSSLASREDWEKAVPIRDYEGFRPYIDRMVAGEADTISQVRDFFIDFLLSQSAERLCVERCSQMQDNRNKCGKLHIA